ncbi:hypothetical protein BO70DRAFT_367221 [Aspergillus heteromorphus CBS 117.55]|uniref:Uncharacterized protein n=1 Tax=Aspergillus heteromorphus CBS 117.55 TaxID=1448321 RepID=A0A317UL55_9EURO|nr:uncharacterized protein BO70DRAFT_367221 [Aspergillus heteromorphus CBS 117.55]PWY62109.1 hypothetical protein BO70DRAFT_367221 [Aspergillus heteromorphus CBS 117.55]
MARVGGEPGWPTLYGKRDRRTDHPIVNHPPRFTFCPWNVCTRVDGPKVAGRPLGQGWPGDWRSPRGHAGARGPPGPTGGERQPAAPATGTY